MQGKFGLGLILLVLGVLANNYVYFHDLFLSKHQAEIAGVTQNVIWLGPYGYFGIVVTLVVIGVGVVLLIRESGSSGTG